MAIHWPAARLTRVARLMTVGSLHGPRVDAEEGLANADAERRLRVVLEGCLLLSFFVHPWKRFIHVCAPEVELRWMQAGLSSGA